MQRDERRYGLERLCNYGTRGRAQFRPDRADEESSSPSCITLALPISTAAAPPVRLAGLAAASGP